MYRSKLSTLTLTLLGTLIPNVAWGSTDVKNDFDGDGISDLVVWRPSSGMWYVITSSGAAPGGASWYSSGPGWQKQWGLSGDTPMTADFDGDGLADLVVVRPGSMIWYFAFSNGASFSVQLGLNGDSISASDCVPNPIYVGGNVDGKDDMRVYRPSTRILYERCSQTGAINSRGVSAPGGVYPDSVVPLSHYTTSYFAVGQEASATLIRYTTAGGQKRVQFGLSYYGYSGGPGSLDVAASHQAVPILGDYSGDGNTDFALYENGQWRIFISPAPYVESTPFFGSSTMLPLRGDYDGDGKDDLAVWNTVDGVWHVFSSGQVIGLTPPHMNYVGGYGWTRQWGLPGDVVIQ